MGKGVVPNITQVCGKVCSSSSSAGNKSCGQVLQECEQIFERKVAREEAERLEKYAKRQAKQKKREKEHEVSVQHLKTVRETLKQLNKKIDTQEAQQHLEILHKVAREPSFMVVPRQQASATSVQTSPLDEDHDVLSALVGEHKVDVSSLEDQTERIQELNQQNTELETRIQVLETQLKDSRKMLETKEQEVIQAASDKLKLVERLAEREQECLRIAGRVAGGTVIQDLQNQLDDMRRQVRDADKNAKEVNLMNVKIQDENAALNSRIKALELSNEQIEEADTNRRKEVTQLKKLIQTAEEKTQIQKQEYDELLSQLQLQHLQHLENVKQKEARIKNLERALEVRENVERRFIEYANRLLQEKGTCQLENEDLFDMRRYAEQPTITTTTRANIPSLPLTSLTVLPEVITSPRQTTVLSAKGQASPPSSQSTPRTPRPPQKTTPRLTPQTPQTPRTLQQTISTDLGTK